MHVSEPLVIEYTVAKGAEKRRLSALLRHKGDFVHNERVIKENRPPEDLIVQHKPKYAQSLSDFLPCSECLAFMLRKDLYRHKCAASADGRAAENATTKSVYMMETIQGKAINCEELAELFARMNPGRVVSAARNDPLIRSFSRRLLKKLGMEKFE